MAFQNNPRYADLLVDRMKASGDKGLPEAISRDNRLARPSRRTKGRAKKAWYAFHRQVGFARWLGFVKVEDDLIQRIY